MIDKIYNLSMERTLLSTLMSLDEDSDYMFLHLKSEYFYLAAHEDLYNVAKELYEEQKPIDEAFIISRLKSKNRYDEVAFIEIISANPISNISNYIQELRDLSIKRHILNLATNLKSKIIEDDAPTADVIDNIENFLTELDISDNIKEPLTMTKVMEDYKNSPTIPKITTGITVFDNALNGGIESSQLVLIGGKSGAGKTMFLQQVLRNVSLDFKSLFFSFEVPRKKIAKRFDRYNQDWKTDNFFIADTRLMGTDVVDVVRKIKEMHRKHGIKFVAADSEMKLTNKTFKGTNKADLLGDMHARLARVTQELDIIIFLITQLSKEDQKNGTMSGYGSALTDYESDMKILIDYPDKESNKRILKIEKNRQDIKNYKTEIWLDKEVLQFVDEFVPNVVHEQYLMSVV